MPSILRSLAFGGHLFWLYTTLGVRHAFRFRRGHFGLLEFRNANLQWCHCCRQLESTFTKLTEIITTYHFLLFVVDASIPSLDCPVCDLDPAFRVRIYGSYLSLLRLLCVSCLRFIFYQAFKFRSVVVLRMHFLLIAMR